MAPTFTCPDVGTQGASLEFQLTVTDSGGLQKQDSCQVNVLWQNMALQAFAGADQTVAEGAKVKLDASGPSDPDIRIAAYQWAQTVGPTVVLSDPQAVAPTFSAPSVGMDGAALSFTLTVVDTGGLKAEDSCVVNIAIQGTAADDRQVARVEWTSDRGYSGVAIGTTNWEIVDLPLKRKRNTIKITAYDTSGNSSSVQLEIFAFTWRR